VVDLMAKTNVKVKLIGKDGNAYTILGIVSRELKKKGFGDLVKEYQEKAMSGDYSNLLRVTMEYVTVM
jgi:hypothetical protein